MRCTYLFEEFAVRVFVFSSLRHEPGCVVWCVWNKNVYMRSIVRCERIDALK